jgi:hypothetical protein
MTAPDRPPAGPSPDGPPPGPRTQTLTMPIPSTPQPPPPMPKPPSGVVPYALLIAGLLVILAAGVLGIVGQR